MTKPALEAKRTGLQPVAAPKEMAPPPVQAKVKPEPPFVKNEKRDHDDMISEDEKVVADEAMQELDQEELRRLRHNARVRFDRRIKSC